MPKFRRSDFVTLLTLHKGKPDRVDITVNRPLLIRRLIRNNCGPEICPVHRLDGQSGTATITLGFRAEWPNGSMHLIFWRPDGTYHYGYAMDAPWPQVSDNFRFFGIRLDRVETDETQDLLERVKTALSDVMLEEGKRNPVVTSALT